MKINNVEIKTKAHIPLDSCLCMLKNLTTSYIPMSQTPNSVASAVHQTARLHVLHPDCRMLPKCIFFQQKTHEKT